MQLEIQYPDGRRKPVPLDPNEQTRIGSDPSLDVVLDGPGVQRMHCAVVHRNGRFTVLASKAVQTVEINGVSSPGAPLSAGDQFKVGPFLLHVVEPSPAVADDDFGLMDLPAVAAPSASRPAPSVPAPKPPADDDFGLAPMDSTGPSSAPASKPAPTTPSTTPSKPSSPPAPSKSPAGKASSQAEEDDMGLFRLEGDPVPGKTPTTKSTAAGSQGSASQAAGPSAAKPSSASPASGDEFGLGGGPASDPLGGSLFDELPAGGGPSPSGGPSATGGLLDDLDDPLASAQKPGPAAKKKGKEPAKPASKTASKSKSGGSSRAAGGGFDALLKSPIWRSPWLRRGAAAVGLMLAAGLVVLGAVNAPTSAERFAAADAEYQARQYTRAASAFDDFLAWHPYDALADEARIKQTMARLSALLDGQSDPSESLREVEQTLTLLGDRRSHAEAVAVWSRYLPKIASGLTDRSAGAIERKQIETAKQARLEAERALALAKQLSPREAAVAAGLPQVEIKLVEIEQGLRLDEVLTAAVTRMEASAASGGLADAYQARLELLSQYPRLSTGVRLENALRKAGDAEKSQIVFTPHKPSAASDSPATSDSFQHFLFDHSPASADSTGPVLVVPIAHAGRLYGLHASDGALVWSLFCGFDAAPTPVPAGDGALVVWRSVDQQLVKLSSSTGEIAWRSPTDSAVGPPIVAGDRVWLTTVGGKLSAFSLVDGVPLGAFQFPQHPTCPPAVDPDLNLIYQPADQAQLYVLSTAGKCEGVVYLGHEAGGVRIAPTILGEFLLILESGLDSTTLRVVQRVGESKLRQSIVVPGQIESPPTIVGDLLHLATDQGRIHSFRFDPSRRERPLTADRAAENQSPAFTSPSHLASLGGRLWLARRGLTSSAPQPPLLFPNADFLSAPQLQGAHLFDVRLQPDHELMVRCCPADDLTKTLWDRPIASPAAALSIDEEAGPVVLHRSSLIPFDAKLLDAESPSLLDRILGPAAAAASSQPAVSTSGRLWKQDAAWVWLPEAGGRELGFAASAEGFSGWRLPAGTAAPPIPFQGQWACAVDGGPLFLFDPRKPAPGAAFWPSGAGTSEPSWSGLVSPREDVLMAALLPDRLLRLTLRDGQWAVAAEFQYAVGFASPLAATGEVVWAVDSQHQLVGFDASAWGAESTGGPIAPRSTIPLGSPASFGPRTVGELLLVGAELGRLSAVAPSGEQRWQVDAVGVVVGAAQLDPQHLAVCYSDGRVELRTADAGALVGSLETHRRLVGEPAVVSGRLVVRSATGELLATRLPWNKAFAVP